jgi:phenylacetate-CoA ligase
MKIALDRALRREIYLDCARQSEADLRKAAADLRRIRPGCLVGFTQATVQLARFVLREKLRDWPAMRVLCGAERLFPEDRPVLEAAFGEPGSVYETYGCREFMMIASECPAHDGLHVSQENLVVEVVDDRGRAAAPGQVGQIAVTDLHNLGMPLIRYVTGDLAVAAAPGSRCGCGRGLSRIAQIEGRQQDLLRGPGGRGIPGIIFNAIIAGLGGKVDQFQAVQRKDGHIDLYLVAGPDYDDGVLPALRGRLQPYLEGVPLNMSLVPTIPPLSSGKRRYVVVEQ